MEPTDRTDPPLAADEATTLRAFLAYHRDTLRWKVSGLDQAQLARTLPPSTMTLGGMLKHLALVESNWIDEVMGGGTVMPPFDTADWDADGDWDWRSAAHDSPEQLLALFDESAARTDRAIDRALATPAGLDTLSVTTTRSTGERFSLRWVLVHLIEEYARHNGHADLIRESIDGATGE